MRVNDVTYFDSDVHEQILIDFEAPLLDHNRLTMRHHGKNFGENGQWDTMADGDHILQDRAVKLLAVELDDVDISKYIYARCPLLTDQGDQVFTDYLGFNGTVTVQFAAPVYDWIIDHIVKHESRRLLDISQPIDTSYDNLFDYSQDEQQLQELETLLTRHAHLSSKRT